MKISTLLKSITEKANTKFKRSLWHANDCIRIGVYYHQYADVVTVWLERPTTDQLREGQFFRSSDIKIQEVRRQFTVEELPLIKALRQLSVLIDQALPEDFNS